MSEPEILYDDREHVAYVSVEKYKDLEAQKNEVMDSLQTVLRLIKDENLVQPEPSHFVPLLLEGVLNTYFEHGGEPFEEVPDE